MSKESFEKVAFDASGEAVDANERTSMDIDDKRNVITLPSLTESLINRSINRTNSDGSEWKVIYDDEVYPSSYMMAARAFGYFGMSTRAVIVPLSAFTAWLNKIIDTPPKPRDDHMFDNKAGAFDYMHALTPEMERQFALERNLTLPSHVRTTADVGMRPLKDRANPFRSL